MSLQFASGRLLLQLTISRRAASDSRLFPRTRYFFIASLENAFSSVSISVATKSHILSVEYHHA